jgi:predicted DCC family thiol-disulfide oxidoreductase YuxK
VIRKTWWKYNLPMKPEFPLQVFYDGACYVCSAEMFVYMRKNHAGRLEFVDISVPEFNPAEHGISLADFMYQLHAIDRAGKVYRGVEAFRAIWQAFPTSTWYGLLGALVTLPGISILASEFYLAFARIRKYFPKRRSAVCRIGRRPPL